MSPVSTYPTIAGITGCFFLAVAVSAVTEACDTWVAMPDATIHGHMILAKTSDVAAFECEPFMRWQGGTHAPGAMIDLQYRKIPQAEKTYTVLGASQFWAWGAEQAINEHGVAVATEAIFTKEWRALHDRATKGEQVARGMLGINLLRLALERGKTAREVLDVMTRFVEEYGQWGSCIAGMSDLEASYDYSYIIADGTEAWILEAVGREWAARKVRKGVANIGNYLSIRGDWDLCSRNMVRNAVEKGWWPADKTEAFDFALAYSDPQTQLAPNLIRGKRVASLLGERQGRIDVDWMFRISRDHLEGTFLDGPTFNAAIPDFLTVCMHDSPAKFTWGITAATNVFVLPAKGADIVPVAYYAANVPCCSVFVPFYVDGTRMPEGVERAGLSGKVVTDPTTTTVWGFTEDSYWWQFDRLRMLVGGDERKEREEVVRYGYRYNERQPAVRAEFTTLEQDFIRGEKRINRQARALIDSGKRAEAAALLDGYSAKCSAAALAKCKALIADFQRDD